MSTLRILRRYLLAAAPLLLAGAALIIIANLLALVPPLVLRHAIDGLSRGARPGDLTVFALQIVGIALVAGGFQFGSRYVINSASRRIEYALRSDLFRHFQRLDLAYFQRNKVGDLVARATNDLSAVRMMLGPGISNLLNTAVAFTVTAIAMVRIAPRLTLYSLTVMPLITVLFLFLGHHIRDRYRRVQDQFGEVSARAQENFSGIRVVKSYVQEAAELAAFNEVNAEYVRRSVAFARVNALLWPSMQFIAGLAIVILLWQGGQDVISGRLSVGTLVQFNAYLAALTWPMIALGWTVNLLQQGSASLSRIQEVWASVPAIREAPQPVAPGTLRGEIEFRDVHLAYDGHEVLHGISLHVPAGGSLAIVGPTGAGKSTLVNLLARVYDVTSGQVLVDGYDVRDLPLETLRRAIGYVPQETFLFSLSIEENVGFGLREQSAERLAHALEVSRLGKDVADFPQGVQTMVGERGVTLSGGQKQRAGIARAIARSPRILILDDALSSVDTHTEAEILSGLRQEMAGRTSIVIAHRISTVKDLDQIVVLKGGRIVERGTHEELLRRDGLYTSMYRSQLLHEELAEELSDDLSDDLSKDGAAALGTVEAEAERGPERTEHSGR